MKIKLGIICGLIIWFLTGVVSSLIKPSIIDNITYINLFVPLSIIIVTGFFGIIYIREINENEVVEGIKVGILFALIDIICDYVFFIIPQNPNILLTNYTTHVFLTTSMMIIITTFLGYLAQMNIELK